jgi:type 2 lantibiotic biosynthesis protein LanM
MRSAFLTISSVEPHATGEPEDFVESPDENSLLTSEGLISVASGLAQKLMRLAERCCHGDTSWMGLHYDMDGYRLKPMGLDLYGGTYGIALFLAACARLTGETVSRDFAREAIQPFAEKLLKPSGASLQKELRTIGIGAASGVGSWVYALTRLSQWLEQPDVLNAATQAALLITPELVEADHHLDIIAGAGGAILGLLALYELTADEEVLQRALLCARHLLSQRIEIEKGASAWLGHGGIVRTGFSHGAAGIAYALLRLYSVTQQQEFLEAASEAINYERLAFVPEEGNWLESHSPAASQKPQYMTSWCYGAAGIGLARLGGLTVLDTPDVRQDLEVALSTTLAYGLPSLDNLCCGNFGRIEFLLASSQRLQRPELLMTAQRHASTLVQRATQLGHFRLLAGLPRHASNPGLFQGYAGIGYELLRLAAPESIPSVLLWE